jgi:hypothetical protein
MSAAAVESRPEPHWPDPPVLPFRLLHLQRNEAFDLLDRLGFDVFLEVNGFLELCAPCLYLLAPHEARCGFALAEHAPNTHNNKLMMSLVDQDRAYEALAELEERVRMRARRLLAPAGTVLSRGELEPEPEPGEMADIGEPPAWVTEQVPYDASMAFAGYDGDDD